MADASDPYELDLSAPELLRDPYRTYARLRANRGVHYRSPEGVCTVVSRYADVRLALLDPRFGPAPADCSHRLAAQPTTPSLHGPLTAVAQALVSQLIGRSAFDVVTDFVEPLVRQTGQGALSSACIANGVLALLTHRDQLHWLHHGAGLPPTGVDELIRFDCPVQRTTRIALADVELPDGDLIAAGDVVTVLVGAANRDYQQFVEPDQLKLDRHNAARHLAFDVQASHRLFVHIAITELLCGLPDLALSGVEPGRRASFDLRRLESLCVLNRPRHRRVG